jgi:peptidyl-prolyl cis-trans isomerase D
MFSLPQGSVRALEGPNDLGWYIVTTDKVTPGDPMSAPQVLQATQAEMARNVGEELLTQFAHAVEGVVGVERNAKAIQEVKRRYLGQAPATDDE